MYVQWHITEFSFLRWYYFYLRKWNVAESNAIAKVKSWPGISFSDETDLNPLYETPGISAEKYSIRCITFRKFFFVQTRKLTSFVARIIERGFSGYQIWTLPQWNLTNEENFALRESVVAQSDRGFGVEQERIPVVGGNGKSRQNGIVVLVPPVDGNVGLREDGFGGARHSHRVVLGGDRRKFDLRHGG